MTLRPPKWTQALMVMGLWFLGSLSAFAIVDGVIIPSAEHPAVVELNIDGKNRCSGVFVSDSTLLTAAHCFVHGVVESVSLYGTDIRAQRIFISKNFRTKSGRLINGRDFAALIFGEEPDRATLVIKTTRPNIGQSCDFIGFGQTDFTENSSTGVDVKRLGRNSIALCDSGFIKVLGKNNKEGCISYGDSGGAFLVNGKLVGLISGFYDGDSYRNFAAMDLTSPFSRKAMQQAVNSGAVIPGFKKRPFRTENVVLHEYSLINPALSAR